MLTPEQSDDAMADMMARTSKMSAADLRRFGNWCFKAAEKKHEAETGKSPAPAPTDG